MISNVVMSAFDQQPRDIHNLLSQQGVGLVHWFLPIYVDVLDTDMAKGIVSEHISTTNTK